MTELYFMMACMHIGLLTGLTLERETSFKLSATILLGGMLWPLLLAAFVYVKWRDRSAVKP
ncbi:hypothetical protein [Pseudomonas sivasensis]|uniref:Uncharacterized protein n=1 Tax=Pseudomonas sivasensis TaxID=1880678 RepID=A0ABW8E533_9PSED